MVKRILFAVIFILLLINQTHACLNGEVKNLKDGTPLYEDREGNVPFGHYYFGGDQSFQVEVQRFDSLYKATKDLDYDSDKGLFLILLKKYQEAIEIYHEIEKIQPNRYSTSSNIGTAYELIGQNDSALKWIKKAVEIDPGSHRNSEWIHVKILEAKVRGVESYTTNFLLQTDFGSAKIPGSGKDRFKLQKLSDELFYQLNERVSFVKPKDEIVARLLFDLGNIAFILGNYQDANGDYHLAKEYGFTRQIIEQRIDEANRFSRIPITVSKSLIIINSQSRDFIYAIGIIATACLIILIRNIYKWIKRPKRLHNFPDNFDKVA